MIYFLDKIFNKFYISYKYVFIYFSLLVGQGAHDYAIANNIETVDPFNLISGNL